MSNSLTLPSGKYLSDKRPSPCDETINEPDGDTSKC